jgi:outer membrane protein
MNRRHLSRYLFCLFSFVAATAQGEETVATVAARREFSPRDAVAAAAANNPDLAAALADLRSVRSLVEGEEHRYAAVWGIEGGVTRTQTPSPGLAGTLVPRTDDVTVSTDLRRQFSHGGNVGITVSGKRLTARTYFGLPPQAYPFGPAYAASVKLDATQPLLRGFGNAVGEANLHQARAQAVQSAATYHRITSDSLAAVLKAYWELAYATQALQIQSESLRLAQLQRDEAQTRVETGAIAAVELTSFETRIAQLEADKNDAAVEVDRRRIELERLCAVDTHDARIETPPEQPAPELAPYAELHSTALARSPSVRELRAAVSLADAQAEIAGDALRPALNVNAYLQAQGLNNKDPGPAVSQIGEMSALSAHVGLRYETSVDSTERRMQVAQARLTVSASRKRAESAERQLDADLRRSYTEARAAGRRIELARRAVELAEHQHQAEKALYETGSSTSIRVREAEEQIRSTRLKLLRARVDAVGVEIELDRITGRLGEAYLTDGR